MDLDGTPTVLALVNDLFFSVKLAQETRRAGFTPRIVKTLAEFGDALRTAAPVLGIIDLGGRVDWDEFRAVLEDSGRPAIPMIAFGPHKAVEALQAARTAGMTRVMSNSLFHAQTAEMIRRYAAPGRSTDSVTPQEPAGC